MTSSQWLRIVCTCSGVDTVLNTVKPSRCIWFCTYVCRIRSCLPTCFSSTNTTRPPGSRIILSGTPDVPGLSNFRHCAPPPNFFTPSRSLRSMTFSNSGILTSSHRFRGIAAALVELTDTRARAYRPVNTGVYALSRALFYLFLFLFILSVRSVSCRYIATIYR